MKTIKQTLFIALSLLLVHGAYGSDDPREAFIEQSVKAINQQIAKPAGDPDKIYVFDNPDNTFNKNYVLEQTKTRLNNKLSKLEANSDYEVYVLVTPCVWIWADTSDEQISIQDKAARLAEEMKSVNEKIYKRSNLGGDQKAMLLTIGSLSAYHYNIFDDESKAFISVSSILTLGEGCPVSIKEDYLKGQSEFNASARRDWENEGDPTVTTPLNYYTEHHALGLYRLVPKTQYVISYFAGAAGDIIRAPIKRQEGSSGPLYDFRFYYDKRISWYNSQLRGMQRLEELSENWEDEDESEQLQEIASDIRETLEDMREESPEYTLVSHNIKESSVQEFSTDENGHKYSPVCEKYVKHFVHDKLSAASDLPFNDPGALAHEHFYGGLNQREYEEALSSIDQLSIGLAVTGTNLDIIPDAMGALYSGFHGQWDDASIYSASAAFPAVSAPVLRAVAKGRFVYKQNGKWVVKLSNDIAVPALYDDVVAQCEKAGGGVQKQGDEVLLLDKQGNEIAQIEGESFKVKKWQGQGEILAETEEGFKLVKNTTGELGINIGFKEGRKLKAETVNEFLSTTENMKAPFKEGTMVEDIVLKPQSNNLVRVIEKESPAGPGGFATAEEVNSVKEVRNKFAILEEWKPNSPDNPLVVRKYEVTEEIQARSGTIGEQIENGTTYEGGGHQYLFKTRVISDQKSPNNYNLKLLKEEPLN